MTSIRRGDAKRVRVTDVAVSRLARLLAQMGLGSDLAGRGIPLPERDTAAWKLLPEDVRILVTTTRNGRVEQWWPREALGGEGSVFPAVFRTPQLYHISAAFQCFQFRGQRPESFLHIVSNRCCSRVVQTLRLLCKSHCASFCCSSGRRSPSKDADTELFGPANRGKCRHPLLRSAAVHRGTISTLIIHDAEQGEVMQAAFTFTQVGSS